METLQHDWELEQLVALFDRLKPLRVLEIGVWDGGTLAKWATAAHVVAVDTEFRPGVEEQFRGRVALIEGDCADQEIIDRVRKLGPFDFIFLDADHQYAAGKRDWLNYSPMVAPGGVFAFHDIRRYQHGDLDRLWAEIKAEPGTRTVEFHQNNADWGGIGAVYL